MGELAIWAMGADREMVSKQEAALAVLRAVRVQCQAAGVDSQGAAPGSGAALQAPTTESQADVAREDVLCIDALHTT